MTAPMKPSKKKNKAFIVFKGESEEPETKGKVLSFLHVSIKKQQKSEEEKMSERTELHAMPQHGTFCWMELSSSNVEASKKFYSELLGWNLTTSEAVPGFDYTEFGVGEQRLGGMFQLTNQCVDEQGKPMKSHWMSYVAVENVDDAATRVFDLGGKICVPPTDIPNVGRFCVINDPSGATLSLITLKNQTN